MRRIGHGTLSTAVHKEAEEEKERTSQVESSMLHMVPIGSVETLPLPAGPRKLYRSRTSSMAQWALCRTLPFLVLVILIHLAAMTSLAQKETESSFIALEKRSYDGHRKGKDGLGGNQVKTLPGDRTSIFATENSTVVTAQIGGTATLPCVVRKFSQGVVSWIRRKDYHLLTVGLTTYSGDGRFLVEHVRHLQNWGLQIKYVQPRDAGLYECQVSMHPPTSIFLELRVIEAAAEILGSPDLHIKSGSTLRLVCTMRQSTEPPVYLFWYHEDRMINYDTSRGVSVLADKMSSILIIKEAEKSDNGNYTCSPSNAKPASINVHVLNATAEEKPAAMQHANTSTSSSGHAVYLAISLMALCFLVLLDGSIKPGSYCFCYYPIHIRQSAHAPYELRTPVLPTLKEQRKHRRECAQFVAATQGYVVARSVLRFRMISICAMSEDQINRLDTNASVNLFTCERECYQVKKGCHAVTGKINSRFGNPVRGLSTDYSLLLHHVGIDAQSNLIYVPFY
ncbi:defective proboscis extension response 13 [Carabus blaptoides fortunei]